MLSFKFNYMPKSRNVINHTQSLDVNFRLNVNMNIMKIGFLTLHTHLISSNNMQLIDDIYGCMDDVT